VLVEADQAGCRGHAPTAGDVGRNTLAAPAHVALAKFDSARGSSPAEEENFRVCSGFVVVVLMICASVLPDSDARAVLKRALLRGRRECASTRFDLFV